MGEPSQPINVAIAQIKTDTIWCGARSLFLFLITAIGLGPTATATTAASPAEWDANARPVAPRRAGCRCRFKFNASSF